MQTAPTEAALALVPEQPSQRAVILADSLKADTEQRVLLGRYISQHMKVDTDFGVIPGTPKPTLYKPGAEKLVDLFRCTPKFKLMKCEEDFDKGFFNYMFRAQLVARDSGVTLAEGYGSCNSKEGRYRWREAQRKCPKCMAATIFASKQEPGFFCWKKKGGCGATFGPSDPSVTSQAQGKVENEDIATMANTILKMAKKRALVDGAIALARCSDMFTQDVEDFSHEETPPAAPSAPAASKPIPPAAPARKMPPIKDVAGPSPWTRIHAALVKAEIKGKPAVDLIAAATGRVGRENLTDADVAKVEAAIAARKKPAPPPVSPEEAAEILAYERAMDAQQAPPPPLDEDAPF